MSSDLDALVNLPVPCPHCHRQGQESIRRLIERRRIPCSFCGRIIDLRGEHWRATVSIIAKKLEEIGSEGGRQTS
jgi:hypothetical protein